MYRDRRLQYTLQGIPQIEVDGKIAELVISPFRANSPQLGSSLLYIVDSGNGLINQQITLRLGTPSQIQSVEDDPNPGYHLRQIPKGVYGEASKIIEEAMEFKDAMEQGSVVMGLMELADLVGAIKEYVMNLGSLTLQDLEKMADITERAFRNGARG